jgi:hypothetical protein
MQPQDPSLPPFSEPEPQNAFLERALRSRDASRASGLYYTTDEVMAELDLLLRQAEKRQ